MATVSATTLKNGLGLFELEPVSKKKTDLEQQLKDHLATLELGFECPACKNDIPDVAFCPFCGEDFSDDEGGDEPSEDADEAPASEDKIAEEVAEAIASKPADKPKDKGKDKASAKPADKPKDKGKDKASAKPADDGEPNDEDKPSRRAGRPTGKTKSSEDKEKEFAELITAIDKQLGEGYEKRARKTGITYVKDSKRLFKAVATSKTISIEFNVAIESDDENLTHYTEEEAKEKHLGSVKCIYRLGTKEDALKFIKGII